MSEERKGARRAASPGRRVRGEVPGEDGAERDDSDPRRLARRERKRRLDRRPGRRLFTATVAIAYDRHVLIAFHASVAREPMEVRVRLATRLGEVAAGIARISEGYDDRSFIARTVVTPGLRDLLCRVENEPYGCAAEGFDVQHVQFVGVEP